MRAGQADVHLVRDLARAVQSHKTAFADARLRESAARSVPREPSDHLEAAGRALNCEVEGEQTSSARYRRDRVRKLKQEA